MLLFIAVDNNDISIVSYLLEINNIDPNISNLKNCDTTLIFATNLIFLEIVKVLLQHPNNDLYIKNKDNKNAIEISKIYKQAKTMKLFINKNDKESYYYYGCMIFKGKRIPVNKEEAIKYSKLAIEIRNSKAMPIYCYMLENGEGILMNKKPKH